MYDIIVVIDKEKANYYYDLKEKSNEEAKKY